VTLRQVREVDLDALYDAHTNIRNRGAYFPLGVMSQTAFRGEFGEHGLWQKSEGCSSSSPQWARSPVTSSSSARSPTGTRSSCRSR